MVCELPQDAAITAVDASNHPVIGGVASGRSEIAALALWLMAERISPSSTSGPLIQALPVRLPSARTLPRLEFRETLTRPEQHIEVSVHICRLPVRQLRRISTQGGLARPESSPGVGH